MSYAASCASLARSNRRLVPTTYARLFPEYGFAVVGDYVSVDGLFEREMLHGSGDDLTLPLRDIRYGLSLPNLHESG